jgi:hypothetical protein
MKNRFLGCAATTLLVCVATLPIASIVTIPVNADAPTPSARRPKLGVVVVFDQMRGDYLIKWRDLFGEGGFKRLQDDGAWFVNCHYPYSDTVTAAGHTSLLTGTTPHHHGIIGNTWYDRQTGHTVRAVDGFLGADPHRRRCPTLGDALQAQTKGKAKVASLSIKDRAAILMAALRAQIVYWLSTDDRFGTSAYYRKESHSWVEQFNAAGKVQAFLGKSWNRLDPKLNYVKFSGPDNVPYEGTGYGQGRTFPHPTPDTWALECSPFGNELLLDFAKNAIVGEQLGRNDDVPDLLCLSFSSNDLIGHSFGPDSQEVLDITLRSDLIVKELLTFLDSYVGKGNYFLAMSADHGICSLPEVARQHEHRDAARVLNTLLSTEAEAFLRRRFGEPTPKAWIEATSSSWVYLNRDAITARGLPQETVERSLADWLFTRPGVAKALTRTELAKEETLADPVAEQVRQSFHPERSGDVAVVLKPYHILWNSLSTRSGGSSTTTHGSPHAYDTHVPLLVYGPGIISGVHEERVTPQMLTPIMARGIGIDPPATALYSVPKGLFESPQTTSERPAATPQSARTFDTKRFARSY